MVAAAPPLLAEDMGYVPEKDSVHEDLTSAIALVKAQLAVQPGNSAAQFELAGLLGRARRYGEALTEYDALILAHAYDVDYALGRAQVLAWLGKNREALEELERATTLAPDYEAVWKLRFRLLRRQEAATDSDELAELRTEAEAKFPQAHWWQALPSERTARFHLTLGASYEHLSNDLPDWNGQYLSLEMTLKEKYRYFGRISRDARFDNFDRQFALGGEWNLPANWTGGVEISTGPGANFQPKSVFSLRAGRRFGNRWSAYFRWGQSRYTVATVNRFSGVAERYFGKYRAAYGLNVSHLNGSENTLAHTMTVDWYLSTGHSLRLNLANGKEAEAVDSNTVLQTDVSSVTISGRHAASDRLTVLWWVGTHRQGDLYRRSYVGLAVTVEI